MDIKGTIINLIKKNRISTTEVADCMGKTGAIKECHAVNRGHFEVGNVKWVYAYNETNWPVHEQVIDVQEGDVVFIEAFNCGDRAIIGELVTKYMVLYCGAAAVVTNCNLRDGNDLIKQNYPVWCKGFNPEGCFNVKPEEPLDESIRSRHEELYEGGIAVCDDTCVVIIPKNLHTEAFIKKLKNIEDQEDTWFECLDHRKWNTYEIVCLKKYLSDEGK